MRVACLAGRIHQSRRAPHQGLVSAVLRTNQVALPVSSADRPPTDAPAAMRESGWLMCRPADLRERRRPATSRPPTSARRRLGSCRRSPATRPVQLGDSRIRTTCPESFSETAPMKVPNLAPSTLSAGSFPRSAIPSVEPAPAVGPHTRIRLAPVTGAPPIRVRSSATTARRPTG